jgi:reactive intermediate/imine deaminase
MLPSALWFGRRDEMPGKIVYGVAPERPLSHAVRAGDFVYVSGQIPTDATGQVVGGGLEAQIRQVLDNIEAALALAGASMDQVVKTTCILEDARDFAAFNRAYAAYFPVDPPARTTIEARLMAKIMVEIDAIAYAPLG